MSVEEAWSFIKEKIHNAQTLFVPCKYINENKARTCETTPCTHFLKIKGTCLKNIRNMEPKQLYSTITLQGIGCQKKLNL